jgi:hypothetical protein
MRNTNRLECLGAQSGEWIYFIKINVIHSTCIWKAHLFPWIRCFQTTEYLAYTSQSQIGYVSRKNQIQQAKRRANGTFFHNSFSKVGFWITRNIKKKHSRKPCDYYRNCINYVNCLISIHYYQSLKNSIDLYTLSNQYSRKVLEVRQCRCMK